MPTEKVFGFSQLTVCLLAGNEFVLHKGTEMFNKNFDRNICLRYIWFPLLQSSQEPSKEENEVLNDPKKPTALGADSAHILGMIQKWQSIFCLFLSKLRKKVVGK